MSAFNPVCATSTPLHTVILAAEAAIFRIQDYTLLAYFTNLFWDLLGFFFLHRIARVGMGMSPPFALVTVAAYGLSVNALGVSAYGMETPMYVALALAGTWYALYSVRPVWGLPLVTFLAPLTRPEGALLSFVLVLLHFRASFKIKSIDGRALWRRTLINTLTALLGLALFFVFYRYAYGHWLPHSIVAKRLEIKIGFLEGLNSWILHVFFKGPSTGGVTAVTLVNILAIAGATVGFLSRRHSKATYADFPWQILVWPGLYFLFFMVTQSSYILFVWYYLPVLPFLLAIIFCGLDRLAKGRVGDGTAWILVLVFLIYVPVQTYRQHIPQKYRFAEQAREGRYREAGRILDSISGPNIHPLVMIDEVGALGYYSKVRILDSHGLLSPEVLPLLGSDRDQYYARWAAMQNRFDPDWILSSRLVKDEGMFYPGEDALFSGYEQALILRRPPHGYNLEMWRRVQSD